MIREQSHNIGDIINKQYKIIEQFDSKEHSSIIYKVCDYSIRCRYNSWKYCRNQIGNPQIYIDFDNTSAFQKEKNKNVTKILQKLSGGIGIPKILWRGMDGAHTITVTECLGPNLKKLFLLMEKKFTTSTIAMIGFQLLHTLENIHKHNYVCCNVMPKEILISLHKKNMTLYITDFKQAKKISKKAMTHTNQDNTKPSANKYILNKFSSVNLHLGLPPSAKDDLESLGYILVYFFKEGNLFEHSLKITNKEEKMKHHELQKLSVVPESLCANLPGEMVTYMNYIKSIQSTQTNDKVDYEFLKKLFKNLMLKSMNLDSKGEIQYDWLVKAKIHNIGSQSKTTERYNFDSSILKLEISPPSTLTIASAKNLFIDGNSNINNSRDKRGSILQKPILMHTNTNGSENNDLNCIPNEKHQSMPTTPKIKLKISDVDIVKNLKYVASKKSLFLHEKQKTYENDYLNGDNIARDVFERIDPDDTVDNKFNGLKKYFKEKKSIEYVKNMHRSSLSETFDFKLQRNPHSEFHLKKSYTQTCISSEEMDKHDVKYFAKIHANLQTIILPFVWLVLNIIFRCLLWWIFRSNIKDKLQLAKLNKFSSFFLNYFFF